MLVVIEQQCFAHSVFQCYYDYYFRNSHHSEMVICDFICFFAIIPWFILLNEIFFALFVTHIIPYTRLLFIFILFFVHFKLVLFIYLFFFAFLICCLSLFFVFRSCVSWIARHPLSISSFLVCLFVCSFVNFCLFPCTNQQLWLQQSCLCQSQLFFI